MAKPILSANSPSAGYISWTTFNIRYGTVDVAIPAGNTNKRYVYWLWNNGSPAAALAYADVLPTTLVDEDLVLFINRAGIPVNVQSANVIDGSIIVNGSIIGDALQANTVDASKIIADSITSREIQAGSILATELATSSLGTVQAVNGDMNDPDPVTKVPAAWTAGYERAGTAPTYATETAAPLSGTSSVAITLAANSVEGMAAKATPVKAGEQILAAVAFRTSVTNVPVTFRAYFGTTENFTAAQAIATVPVAPKNVYVYDITAGGLVPRSGIPTPLSGAGIAAIADGWASPVTTGLYMTGQVTVPNGARFVRFVLASGLQAGSPAHTIVWDALEYAPLVTSARMADGTVEARMVQADAITATAIKAESIGSKHLVIADTGNMAELNEQQPGQVGFDAWTNAIETNAGVPWSVRNPVTSSIYFMFRNKKGPLPFKTGDRIRLTFEAYASAATAFSANLYVYGAAANAYSFTAMPGSATSLTTAAQQFAYELDVPALTDQTTYLLGIANANLANNNVRVRNVRAYLMSAGELVVDGSIKTNHMAANSINADRIDAATLTIGKVQGLTAALDADAINTNASFSGWASTYPDGWKFWAGTVAKETALARTPPNAVRINCTDATTPRGIQSLSTDAGSALASLPLGLDYVTVSIDAYLASGTSFSGAGVLFDWSGIDPVSSKYRTTISLGTEIPAPVVGKWYRVTKVLKKPAGTNPQTAWNAFLMANYAITGGVALTVKDIIYNRLAVRPSTAEEVSAYNAAPAASVTDLDSRVAAKGTDLITNGTGLLGTNYNFAASFDFNGADAPTGAAGSFVIKSGVQQSAVIDELIPFDPTKPYRFSFQIRQTLAGAVSKAYGFISPYDAQNLNIQPYNYMWVTGTTTTLAQALNPGDTTIKLTSAANWWGQTGKVAGASTHYRSIIWWDYVAGGKAWPVETYSRNWSGTDYWADGGVDLATNTITLKAPYAGVARPAGTPLSNGSSGGSFVYMPSLQNGTIPETWTPYADTFSAGILASGGGATGTVASWTQGLPPGTAKIKVGWLLNYAPTSGKHAVAAVSFSDASAANFTANAVTTLTNGWKFTGKTTINGGAIEADSIKVAQLSAGSIGAKQLVVADTANMAELNEATAGAVSYSGATHIIETVSGTKWSKRDLTTNQYLMFRNQVGPLPFKTGDRIRVTFEAFADATVAAEVRIWTYGGSTNPGTLFTVAPTPSGGTAWPTNITTTPQSFAFEGVAPAVTDQTMYLIGLNQVLGRDVRVRNVRAYRMGAGELLVDGTIEGKHIKAGTVDADRIIASTLTIGKVFDLSNQLAGKEAAGAAAAAQTAAQNYADATYSATKDRVMNTWTFSGQTTINGGAIQTDSILATAIKAHTIGADQLIVGGVTNLVPNGMGEWGVLGGLFPATSTFTFDTVDKPAGATGAFKSTAGQGSHTPPQLWWDVPAPAVAGESVEYLVEVWAKADRANSVLSMTLLDQGGSASATCTAITGETSAAAGSSPLSNAPLTTAWTLFTAKVVVAAGTTKMRVGSIDFNGAAGSERAAVQSVAIRVRGRGTGRLLVDGSIEAKHIKANSIKADAIDVGAITVDKIQAGVLRTNMVGDPSFEETYALTDFASAGQGLTHQWRYGLAGTGGTVTRTVGKARSGIRKLELAVGATGGTGTSAIAYSPVFLVEAGKTYRVNWYATANGAGATGGNVPKLTVDAIFGPSAGALVPGSPIAVSEGGATTVPYTVAASTTAASYEPGELGGGTGDLVIPGGQANLYCSLRFTSTNNQPNCTIWLDDVSAVESGIGGASEWTAAGLRLFDDEGDEATALVTNRPSYFTVTKDGNAVAAVDQNGVASFAQVNADDDMFVSGSRVFGRWDEAAGNRSYGTSWETQGLDPGVTPRDFTAEPVGIVEGLAGGVMAHMSITPATTTMQAAGAYQKLAQVTADLEMGRFYSVRTSPIMVNTPAGSVVGLVLRYAFGSDPTPASPILVRDYQPGGGYVSLQIGDRPIGGTSSQRDLRILATVNYVSGTGAMACVSDPFYVTVYDEGYQPNPSSAATTGFPATIQATDTPTTPPASKKTYTTTWKANGTQTRRGSNSFGAANTINSAASTSKAMAGYYSGSNGVQHAYFSFTAANSTGSETGKAISDILNVGGVAATVKKVELYVKNASFYASSGGRMQFAMSPLTAITNSTTLAPPTTTFTGDVAFTVGQGRWITLPTAALATLQGGGRVVCLYPGAGQSSRAYYSGWAGHTAGGGVPMLRVTYER